MAINILRNEENPRIALPRRQIPIRDRARTRDLEWRIGRHASVFDAGAIGPRIGSGAPDSALAATDGHRGELSRGSLYPLRIAARVFALLGIAALFYALVLVTIFVRSDIVVF